MIAEEEISRGEDTTELRALDYQIRSTSISRTCSRWSGNFLYRSMNDLRYRTKRDSKSLCNVRKISLSRRSIGSNCIDE